MERQQALIAVQQDWRRLGEMSQQYRSANVPIDCASCCHPSEVTVALGSDVFSCKDFNGGVLTCIAALMMIKLLYVSICFNDDTSGRFKSLSLGVKSYHAACPQYFDDFFHIRQ